jgi:hypothetical protein
VENYENIYRLCLSGAQKGSSASWRSGSAEGLGAESEHTCASTATTDRTLERCAGLRKREWRRDLERQQTFRE